MPVLSTNAAQTKAAQRSLMPHARTPNRRTFPRPGGGGAQKSSRSISACVAISACSRSHDSYSIQSKNTKYSTTSIWSMIAGSNNPGVVSDRQPGGTRSVMTSPRTRRSGHPPRPSVRASSLSRGGGSVPLPLHSRLASTAVALHVVAANPRARGAADSSSQADLAGLSRLAVKLCRSCFNTCSDPGLSLSSESPEWQLQRAGKARHRSGRTGK